MMTRKERRNADGDREGGRKKGRPMGGREGGGKIWMSNRGSLIYVLHFSKVYVYL